jgi:hypothetical protein
MPDQPDPHQCAQAVLQKLAAIANRELPIGYTIRLELHPLGESFVGMSISVTRISEKAPQHERN